MAEIRTDAVVVGAGHNGLVAALTLVRAGLDVTVIERDTIVGGACRTEYPFAKVPGLGTSTGAYLFGLMPPELMEALDVVVPRMRRDPHYFLPTTGRRYLMLGADPRANHAAVSAFASEADADALDRLAVEIAALRDDLAPAWLAPPRPVHETADRYVRPTLQSVFVDLVTGSVGAYLDRFSFTDPLLPAMLATTDAFPGSWGGYDTPGSGHNFLVHNLGRLPGADGTWTVVPGGMGTVTRVLADAGRRHGVRIETATEAVRVVTAAGRATGVVLADGREIDAPLVLVATDPFRLRALVPDPAMAPLDARLDRWRQRPGTTLKINLAMSRLPRYTSLPEPRGQHGATVHLLPPGNDPVGALRSAWADAQRGDLPTAPPIEVYGHTAVDPTLQDAAGHHAAALFVQWVPPRPSTGTWDEVGDAYADHLLDLASVFAPDFRDLPVDRQVLHPTAIERHFGITGGHIFHVDNSFAFDQRLAYEQPVRGLLACGAGCHPAGSVIGAAGWNAARIALQ